MYDRWRPSLCCMPRFLTEQAHYKHSHATRHPIIKSFDLGEDWGRCYVDEIFLDLLPVNVGSHHS